MGKFVFLNGLWVLMGKAPVLAGAFLITNSIIADGVKLIGKLYSFCFQLVGWFRGLTCDFAGFSDEKRI